MDDFMRFHRKIYLFLQFLQFNFAYGQRRLGNRELVCNFMVQALFFHQTILQITDALLLLEELKQNITCTHECGNLNK